MTDFKFHNSPGINFLFVIITIFLHLQIFLLSDCSAAAVNSKKKDTKTITVKTNPGIAYENLCYLGTVGGKSYYAEINDTLIWTRAKQRCVNYNMSLASITTESEFDFLRNALVVNHLRSSFWTSLRESRDWKTAMVWDNDRSRAKPSLFQGGFIGSNVSKEPFQYCGRFDHKGVLATASCATKKRFICEADERELLGSSEIV